MEQNIEELLKSSLELEFVTGILQKLNEIRKENKFCDVTLKINNKDLFSVHKTIIASSCEYFGGLFKGDWKETREDVISLDYGISSECFELLLEYLYTGTLSLSVISYENTLTLHKAAVFFNLLKFKNIMSKILQNFINPETLLNLWHHGVNYFDNPLRDKCLELISKSSINFLEKNLNELTFEEMKSLCEKKILNCSEEEIYENFVKWTKADFESREKYLKDLLDLVDFSKISGKFIKSKILSDEFFFKNEEFVRKIMRGLSNNFEIFERNIIETTVSEVKKLTILLISDTGIFKIDLENNICQHLLSHNISENFAVTNFGFGNILICGAVTAKPKICNYYCAELNIIREFPPMLHYNVGQKAISVGDKIYIFGFDARFSLMDSMQIFDITTRKWSFGPIIPKPRINFALEEYDGCIYVMGGIDSFLGDSKQALPTDIFDVMTMKWKSDCNFNAECFKSVCIGSTGYLFKSDGYNKYDFKNKILKENCFTFEEELDTYDAVKFINEIFIVGRKDSGELYSAVIDVLTEKMTEFKIDFSQCGDIGSKINLITAYL